MRPIRVFDTKEQKMYYKGFFVCPDGSVVWRNVLEQDQGHYIRMDSTGLKDKNGNEIYEGDIYKDANGIISVVEMAVDGWALFSVKKGAPVRNLYWHNVCDKTKGEIIGNIHEKGKDNG